MLDQRPELADALSDQLACLDHVGARILAPAVSLRHRIPQGHPADLEYELHEPSSSGETDSPWIPGLPHPFPQLLLGRALLGLPRSTEVGVPHVYSPLRAVTSLELDQHAPPPPAEHR